ncbi:MAG: endo-beta-N-acetylglucosaminidase [Bacteroidaceae bacterium]|nr:endo-beta-N-acetylglucosaminidase [Bacteroidaceae bacterium]
MRRIILTALAALAIGSSQCLSAQEYDASASREIYDFSQFGESGILTLFYNAQQDGRNVPTRAEFEAAGFNMTDIEFVRSHVRPRAIIDDQENQLVNGVKNTRRLWMNIPMGTAKGIGGYPGTNAGDDTYSIWNYTHLFGAWNHGLFQAPGCWIDAAHQNGTDIFTGIKFFESWTPGSGDAAYSKLITEKNDDGTFKYVKPLISALMYFGADGINYNWEDGSYSNADIVAFHKALYKEAEERGFKNFHIGLYTSISSLTASNANALFGNADGRTAETFLNYSGNNFISAMSMRSSETAATNAMGTTDGLYAGVWIVTMNRSWTNLAGRDIGAVLWGEHANSRFWSNNVGNDAQEFQGNYQALLERTVSGGNRNPANRPVMKNTGNEWGWSGTTPPLSSFGGLATYFPERSAIQGKLPFHTYFNTGIGEVYTYKGKRTHGNWYNMSTQDIVPTYRWLVYDAGTTTASTVVSPEFTIEDAYMGGSCLRLTGTADGSADIILFRTALTGTEGQPYAKIAVKTKKEGETETGLSLIVKVGGEWKEYPVGTTTGTTWEEKTIELTGISSTDQIDFVGLRANDVTSDYQVFVGELQLNDDVKAEPAPIKEIMAEVKKETTTKLSVKLTWSLDKLDKSEPLYGMVYNDECLVDHFEVLYKNGEDGRVSVVSHVQGWSAFVGDVPMAADEQPYFGVRAVGTDLKSYSEPQWVAIGRSSNVPEGAGADELEYGVSEINPDAEGYQTAITTRYLTKVTTTGASVEDLNYTCSSPGPVEDRNYVNASQEAVLKVKQGDEITVNYEWLNSGDGIQWCIMKGYADWNINGFFEGATDELIIEQGQANTNNSIENTPEYSNSPLHPNGYTNNPFIPFKVKIPEDAVCGKTRIRIVFTDAWAAHPGPVGLTAKGFSIDFGVEISGDNPERQPTVKPYDEGEAEEPENLRPAPEPNAVKNIHEVSEVTLKNGSLEFTNVEKAWVYTTDGRLVRFVKNPAVVATDFPAGAYIVKMQNRGVIRSRKVTIK